MAAQKRSRRSGYLAFGLFVVAASTVVLAGTKIKAQGDPKFDFSTLKTWEWDPKSPGEVRIWVSKDSKSEPVKRQYEPVILQAVEEPFKARGYSRATGLQPDFLLTYYLLVTAGNSSQYMGQFLPANAGWGLPLFAPQTTAMSYYPEGTLVLDVVPMSTREVVWRGMAQAEVETESTEAKRTARLQKILKDLIAKFPKRKQ
jgi:Domain of unknown function (DUF4136)